MDALDKMAEHIGDPMTAVDVGPRFNCGELDSIVGAASYTHLTLPTICRG